jgi:hypothetical protein
MKPVKRKMRAIELFAHDTPFKPKVVKSKKLYTRRPRSNKKDI